MKILSVDRDLRVVVVAASANELVRIQGFGSSHEFARAGRKLAAGDEIKVDNFYMAVTTLRDEAERLERLRDQYQRAAAEIDEQLAVLAPPKLDS